MRRPVRFIRPGRSGIKQREYFLIKKLWNIIPIHSRNFSFSGNGITGRCVTYTAFYFPAPEAESIIAYDDINFVVADDPFYSKMLIQDMKTKKRCFKEEEKILRQETWNSQVESPGNQ